VDWDVDGFVVCGALSVLCVSISSPSEVFETKYLKKDENQGET
jgi:hypothetical protein